MTRIVAEGETTEQVFEVADLKVLTVVSHGGSTDTIVTIANNTNRFVNHTTISGGVGYARVPGPFVKVKVTPGTGATYDIFGHNM